MATLARDRSRETVEPQDPARGDPARPSQARRGFSLRAAVKGSSGRLADAKIATVVPRWFLLIGVRPTISRSRKETTIISDGYLVEPGGVEPPTS
jgi:hypothetical protein